MSNVIKKMHWSSILLRCIWMIIGALIYTVGLDLFLVPNNIIDGGVVGISLMTAELTGISFSIFVVLILAIALMARYSPYLPCFLSFGWPYFHPLPMNLLRLQPILF